MKAFMLIFALIYSMCSSADIMLTESSLLKMIEKKPPGLDEVEASFLKAKFDHLSLKDQLSFRLDGEGRVFESKERLLNSFDGGVIQNATNYSLALNKPTRYGVDLGLKVFGDKVTNAFVSDAATNGVTLSLAVDLFRNFLGKKTDSDLKRSALGLKRAELEKKLSTTAFESNIRKVYWALVANQERTRLLTSLVKTSEKQYKDTRRKRRSGVADAGEVARTRAQWSTRKSSLLSVQYQRGQLVKSLKEMLPELKNQKIAPISFKKSAIKAEVLKCTNVIANSAKAPLNLTSYDEIAAYLIEEEKLEQRALSGYSAPVVKLVGEVSQIGRDFGLENAREDLVDDGQPRLSLGLQVSVPLGGRKKDSQKTAKAMAKMRYRSQAQTNLLKVHAFHEETVGMVKILRQVIESQGSTNSLLEESLRISKKKYNQARIGLPELIVEQEAYFQSKLSEIDSNLTIMNILMDYFSVFNETPCALNKIGRI